MLSDEQKQRHEAGLIYPAYLELYSSNLRSGTSVKANYTCCVYPGHDRLFPLDPGIHYRDGCASHVNNYAACIAFVGTQFLTNYIVNVGR